MPDAFSTGRFRPSLPTASARGRASVSVAMVSLTLNSFSMASMTMALVGSLRMRSSRPAISEIFFAIRPTNPGIVTRSGILISGLVLKRANICAAVFSSRFALRITTKGSEYLERIENMQIRSKLDMANCRLIYSSAKALSFSPTPSASAI